MASDPKDGDTRQREGWIQSWHDDVERWAILCSVDEWRVWQIEGSDHVP